MDRVDHVDSMFGNPNVHVRYVGSREEYKTTFTSMLQLLFYLCRDEPDMPEIERPQKRRTLSGDVRTPEEPRVWDVTPAHVHMSVQRTGTPTGLAPCMLNSRKEKRS